MKDHRPLHERIGDVIRKRRELYQKLNEERVLEIESALVDKPAINPTSDKIVRRKSLGSSRPMVHDRLLHNIDQNIGKSMIFAPQIDANSDRIVAGRFTGEFAKFENRQKLYQASRKPVEQILAEDLRECTFVFSIHASASNRCSISNHGTNSLLF
eukprot:TRINITY_DN10871_c0_g1_i1.p1 TRINITY_DN10871_c0_g1~~TRINITY_DN10871_c0_g1_i1.p1  ORF type:complete len:156 (-),score=26.13 TRINITY_DN10871_c0_g1_i1:435-902(-)